MSRPWDGLPTPLVDARAMKHEPGTEPQWYEMVDADDARDLERQLRYYKDKLDEAQGLLVDWMDSDGWEEMPIDETDAHLEAAKEADR